MSYRWLVLLLALFSIQAYAYEWPIEIVEYVENARVVAFINESDMDDSLRWQPFEGAPPLSMEKAISAIQQYIAGQKELKNAKLLEIALRQIPHHEEQWHYMVKMKTVSDNKVRFHYLVVLMSGKIIPAIREPGSVR